MTVWCAFKAVVKGFLSIRKNELRESLVDSLAQSYKRKGLSHVTEIVFLSFTLGIFPVNMGAEQGHFYQNIFIMGKYQGHYNSVRDNYGWCLKRTATLPTGNSHQVASIFRSFEGMCYVIYTTGILNFLMKLLCCYINNISSKNSISFSIKDTKIAINICIKNDIISFLLM